MKRSGIFLGIGAIFVFFFLPILSVCMAAEEEILGKMIYIPEGDFIVGSDDPELRGYFNIFGGKARFQKAVGTTRKVHVKGFYIDAHEVTQGQWCDFFNTLTTLQKATRDLTGASGKNTDAVFYRNTLAYLMGCAELGSLEAAGRAVPNTLKRFAEQVVATATANDGTTCDMKVSGR